MENPKPIPQKIAGYQLLQEIGKGGMGTVYKAKQIAMERTVAIKILHPELALDQEYLERFFREAKAMAKLDHPNIVRAIDIGQSQGYYYFSMEYVEGQDMAEYLKQHGKLEETEAVHITLQIAHALAHAHKFYIIHRDIKPQNIFLTKDKIAKLGDLGLAKPLSNLENQELTQKGTYVGTPYYVAPEQVSPEQTVDIRSDIYSLGITLFKFLTGKVPYHEETELMALAKRIAHGLPNILSYNPHLSPQIVSIVKKMTATNPCQRYQTPQELIQELQRFQEITKPSSSSKILLQLSQESTSTIPPTPLPPNTLHPRGRGRPSDAYAHPKIPRSRRFRSHHRYGRHRRNHAPR